MKILNKLDAKYYQASSLHQLNARINHWEHGEYDNFNSLYLYDCVFEDEMMIFQICFTGEMKQNFDERYNRKMHSEE